jgi:hypothetical protein
MKSPSVLVRQSIFPLLISVFIISNPAAGSALRAGTVRGIVSDARTGLPVARADVLLAGTVLRAATDERGRYAIEAPAGIYTVQVHVIGYRSAARTWIIIEEGGETELGIALVEAPVGGTVEILVEGSSGGNCETCPEPEIIRGETKKDRSRGSRAVIDIETAGIDDPLGGRRAAGVPLDAARSDMFSGGMDARYGTAQSTIVQTGVRDGGRAFSGDFRYMTDNFRIKDKTYTNYDRLSLNIGGPLLSRRIAFHVAAEASFTDGEYMSVARRGERDILGGLLAMDERPYENFDLQGNISWHARPGLRLTGEAIYSRVTADRYIHNWNTEGYVQKIYRFLSLGESRESSEEDARAFGYYVSFYHGPWVEQDLPRYSYYPPTIEERRRCLYPVTIFAKVRDPDNPSLPPFIIRYGSFFARILENIHGEEVEVIWDEQVIAQDGSVESYESKMLFEGFQEPESKFSHFRDDSSYVYFNSAEHTLTTTSKNLSLKVRLDHRIGDDFSYTVAVSRLRFDTVTDVGGKEPREYETAGEPVILPSGAYRFSGISNRDFYTDGDYPYLVTCYDYPYYGKRANTFYALKADMTSTNFGRHGIASGLRMIYSETSENEVYYPGSLRLLESGGYQQGLFADEHAGFNTEGAFYVQDKCRYLGISSNIGLRIDVFSPRTHSADRTGGGGKAPYAGKVHVQVNPRLGFSFPLSTSDVLHFHYGRFTTWPMADYLFGMEAVDACPFVVDNPDLAEECTVAYQAGLTHRFTESISGHVVVFSKDITGLVTTSAVVDVESGTEGCTFVNGMAGSARGIEFGFRRMLSASIGGEISYVYSVSRREPGFSAIPADSPCEIPLDWDQRHALSAVLRVQGGRSWQATFVYQYGSGLPWTPVDRFARRQDPCTENSRRLESTHVIHVSARKNIRFHGFELAFFFEGFNILDQDILMPGGTAPGAWPPMRHATMDGGAYLTETGRYGGAYMQDIDNDGIDDFIPVNDPTIWALHRRLRVGFGFGF